MTFLYFFYIACFLILCLLMCMIILVQEGKGGGLGTTFGASDNSDSLFGTSTPEILKKITGWMATAFVISCLLLSLWTGSLARHNVSSLTDQTPTEISK